MLIANRRVATLAVVGLLTACATLSGQERAGSSTVGCAQSAVNRRPAPGSGDKLVHCVAAGMIARYCSAAEAYLTGAAKEVRDAFSATGNAEWADLRANAAGVRCARSARDDAGLVACCERSVARYTAAPKDAR